MISLKNCIAVMLLLQTATSIAAEEPLTLSANSTRINMETSAADFNGNIVIHHGNMKIIAATLVQQNSSNIKQEKMFLTGDPVLIDFKQQDTNLDTHIEARKIIFFPKEGLLEISGQSKLTTTDKGKLQTSIEADEISIKHTPKKIQTVAAKGTPLRYQFTPAQGEIIIATAEQLNMNQISGDVELHKATVNQGSNQLRAGKIEIDGKTGNLSANRGDETRPPSLSIEFKAEEIKRLQEKQEQQP